MKCYLWYHIIPAVIPVTHHSVRHMSSLERHSSYLSNLGYLSSRLRRQVVEKSPLNFFITYLPHRLKLQQSSKEYSIRNISRILQDEDPLSDHNLHFGSYGKV